MRLQNSDIGAASVNNLGETGFSNVGAVVGASAYEEARIFLEIHPSGWFWAVPELELKVRLQSLH